MIDDPQAQEILAELAESTASALVAFAQAIRPASDAADGDELANAGLGRRQQEIAAVAGLDTEEGMSTREVACAIDYDAANTHTALYALAARGIAESFRHGEHTRWRLTPRYRSANPYLAIAQLVAPGDWTTFDDISLVVHGDLRHGHEVLRASVDLPDFPAHRVLPPGGQIPRAWRSYATKTPDPGECVRLLAGEGVPIDGEGRASRAHRIGWDVLAERAAHAGRLG
jgi:hypothetical protein